MRPLLRRLLEREQLVGAEVALVVARARARRGRAGTRRRAPSAPSSARAEHTFRVSDLFSDAAGSGLPDTAPLALRLRPRTLDEFVGQEHVLGEGSALRRAIARGPRRLGDLLRAARAPARRRSRGSSPRRPARPSRSSRRSRPRCATSAPCSPRARERLGAQGQRTILFLDEIHRFNKAQQDALLPAVEEGLVTLIGATTENPYFEVNSALLSRVQLYELQPLDEEELARVVRRGRGELGVELARRRARADRRAARAATHAAR